MLCARLWLVNISQNRLLQPIGDGDASHTMLACYDHVIHTFFNDFIKTTTWIWVIFLLTSPQIRYKCACHACIHVATLGRIWPRLAVFGYILSKILMDVRSMVEHGHNWSWLVTEWTNSDHVQLGHFSTMNKFVQLWTVDANRAVLPLQNFVFLQYRPIYFCIFIFREVYLYNWLPW